VKGRLNGLFLQRSIWLSTGLFLLPFFSHVRRVLDIKYLTALGHLHLFDCVIDPTVLLSTDCGEPPL